MTGSPERVPRPPGPGVQATGIRLQRPAAGQLLAGSGSVLTLVSLFFPWYELHLRITGYASLSAFAILRVGNIHLSCDPPAGASCSESASVGALVAGVWDWRTLIAVGAAVTLLYLVACVMRTARAPRAVPDWRAVTALASATGVFALLAVVVNPVSVPSVASMVGIESAPSYGAAIGLAGAVLAVIGGLLLRWEGLLPVWIADD